MLTQTQRDKVQETIEALDDAISGAAYKVALLYCDDMENVKQLMHWHIVEAVDGDPEFLDQTPAFIVQHAKHRAMNSLRSDRNHYTNHLAADPVTSPEASDDLDSLDFHSVIHDPWETITMSLDLRDEIESLPRDLRDVVSCMLCGFSANETAAQLGFSRRTYYTRRDEIAARFAVAGLSPA